MDNTDHSSGSDGQHRPQQWHGRTTLTTAVALTDHTDHSCGTDGPQQWHGRTTHTTAVALTDHTDHSSGIDTDQSGVADPRAERKGAREKANVPHETRAQELSSPIQCDCSWLAPRAAGLTGGQTEKSSAK